MPHKFSLACEFFLAKKHQKSEFETHTQTEEMEETVKSAIAIRCAKAAILISSLKSTARLNSTKDESEEGTMMLKRAVEELKRELVRERVKNRKIRLCSVNELLLQIILLLSLWSLCSMLVVNLL